MSNNAVDFAAVQRKLAAGERPVTLPQAGSANGTVPFSTQPNQQGQAARAPSEPGEFYLNIGVTVPLMQEDGSTQDTFVSIGGVTLRPTADVGKTSGVLANAKRAIHKNLLQIGYASLEPGQAAIVTEGSLPLKLEFRRPRDPNAPASANEAALEDAISALFSVA